MGHVNAFIEAGNDHRRVSIGGRGGSNNKVWAWLNTAHKGGETDMRISAEVMGLGLTSQERRRKEPGDQRRAYFQVELPEPSDHIKVEIVQHDHALRVLAGAGAVLCGVKAADEMLAGRYKSAEKILSSVKEVMAGFEEELKELPTVTLPGGVSLKHALACVKLVEKLTSGQGHSNQ